eukprot:9496027-Pyramimonas_sp.AAC.1
MILARSLQAEAAGPRTGPPLARRARAVPVPPVLVALAVTSSRPWRVTGSVHVGSSFLQPACGV